MAIEGFVQVAEDGSGKKIRNLVLEVVQPDGTVATVLMQAVSIVDSEGRAADFGGTETNALLRSLLREMSALRRMYGRATGQQHVALDSGALDDIVG